ncbi:MAG: hypothetical protein RL685_1603 [Pseudomonadota bacterium]|jgi:hypothetical protein
MSDQMPDPMRASLPLLLCALALSARAEALEPTEAREPAETSLTQATALLVPAEAPVGVVGLDSHATRHGTSYETVYQLSLEPSATLRFGSLGVSALLPLSTSATYPTFCCRLTLGNATVAIAQRNVSAGLRHWYEASVSLPTSHWSDAHASSLAATAALLRDAGYYLPDTTTLRAGLGAELDVTHWLALSASAAAHHWLRPGEDTDPLIVPLTAGATLRSGAWSARTSYRSLLRLLDPGTEERFLSELSAGIAYTWPDSRLETTVSLPLDESLRELGMLSIGSRYSRSF